LKKSFERFYFGETESAMTSGSGVGFKVTFFAPLADSGVGKTEILRDLTRGDGFGCDCGSEH
jgi:hypothetical protein